MMVFMKGHICIVSFQMLAKEILEDTLLSTLTQNVPDVEIDSGTTSEKVITDFTMKKQGK